MLINSTHGFLPEWASDIGCVVTILGFIITIYQILKIKRTTSSIKTEVLNTQSKIQKALAISDLSKSSETIKTIYSYLNNGNYELAHTKIMEINDLIIEIKEVPVLKDFEGLRRLEDYGKYLAKDLKDLQEKIIVEHTEVGKDTIKIILGNLRAISDLFAKINAQLKHSNNE